MERNHHPDVATSPATVSSHAGIRRWARSYLLAGRIAAGIFQVNPLRRLPEPYAYVRTRGETAGRFIASERIGDVILTLPLEGSDSFVVVPDRSVGGERTENPFALPRLSRDR